MTTTDAMARVLELAEQYRAAKDRARDLGAYVTASGVEFLRVETPDLDALADELAEAVLLMVEEVAA